MSVPPPLSSTPRTVIRRGAKRSQTERNLAYAVIDEALLAHVATVVDGTVRCQPMSHWRVGDEVLLHGSPLNGLMTALRDGAEATLTVTLLDGLVLARSAFHHSVNYRSVVAYGRARVVEDAAEKMAAFHAMLDKYAPGRWDITRPPSDGEMKATLVLALPLDEMSCKARSGPPVDAPADYALDVWAGVVPLRLDRGEPQQDQPDAPPIA